MKIARFVFNPFGENTYILWDDTAECVIVDAGNNSAREDCVLTDFITEHKLTPVMAINTHGHFDHIVGVEYVKSTFGVPFAVSSLDMQIMEEGVMRGRMFGIQLEKVPNVEIDLSKSATVKFGNTHLQVIPSPGHTEGGVVLYEPESQILITGDTLFRESIGRTDMMGGDYSKLMHSILEHILPLGDEVKIYPGHGESSTIGHESLYNPFVVEALNNEIDY